MKSPAFALSFILLAGSISAPTAHAATRASAPAPALPLEGRVAETMNASGYTYLQVESGNHKVWVAAPELAVKVGDQVTVKDGAPMTNYHSKTLNRTFDVVYFAGSVAVNNRPTAAAATPSASKAPAAVDLSNIKRAPNGQTVAEIYAGSAKLAGEKVTFRGRVVKFNGGIMGKNWLHVRDGTGSDGSNDLTITSQGKAKVGDLVLVTGVLATNRNFGGGYKYPVIIEEATIVVE